MGVVAVGWGGAGGEEREEKSWGQEQREVPVGRGGGGEKSLGP